MKRTVRISELKGGDVFYVSGKVSYSHVSRLIDGDALQRSIERQKRQGSQYPVTRPHTTLSVEDARVLMRDPQNPTKAEIFAKESLYQVTNRETGATTWCFNEKNTSRYLPRVLVKREGEDKVYDEVKLERELDNGLRVTLVISVFDSGKGNPGRKLDTILVEEPLRYYHNDVVSKLEAMGLTVNRLPNDETDAIPGTVADEPEAEAPANSAPVQNVPQSPFSVAGAPAAAGQASPVEGFTAAPMNDAPVGNTNTAPAQAPAADAPVGVNPFADPYAITDNSGVPGGLVYNPNEEGNY